MALSALAMLVFFTAAGFGLQGRVPGAPQTPAENPAPKGATINGVIQDDRGAPVAEAKVAISSEGFSSSALTQADGKFEFRALPVGVYRITAEAARFRKGRATVTVTRPDEVLTPVVKLASSSLHVRVVDANNQPLSGVTLTLSNQDRGVAGTAGTAGAIAARTSTDESGDAYFGRLAPNPYQLTAILPGYEEKHTEVLISYDSMTDLPLRLLVAPVIPINEKSLTRYNVPSLPSKNVQSIFQDSDGWIWFGTDKGAARFNGSGFISSGASNSPYDQLAGEDIRSIAEDPSGTIWLATPGGVRQITKQGEDVGTVLNHKDPRHVTADSKNNMWVSTAKGLFRFSGSEFTLFAEAQGLASADVRATAEDGSGRIWIATAGGLAFYENDAITQFEPAREGAATGAPAAADTAPRAPQPAASPRPVPGVSSLFVDRAGAVWFATRDGVSVFDGTRVSDIPIDALRAQAASSDPASDESNVVAISQDRLGRMCFALRSGGALLYDPARRESQRLSSLDRDRVISVFVCREGNNWFGTSNGVVEADYYGFVNFTTSRGLSDNDVLAVVEDPSRASGPDRLWFVTASGISRMENERFISVERFRPNTNVRAVAFDSAGAAWVATQQGVLRFSGQTLTQLNEGNGLIANEVNWVASTEGGSSIVFATARGVSVYKDGEFRNLNPLSSFDVRHVFEDANGKLWFATSRGLVAYDPRTDEAELIDSGRGLADNDTRWVTRFKDRLLVATRAGVQVYNDSNRVVSPFATFDGDPASTLFVDRDGYLWVGTDDGQVKKFAVKGANTIWTVYSGEPFALAGGRVNSIFEDGDRRIWIATNGGAVRHMPVRAAPRARVSLEVEGRAEAASGAGPHSLSYGRQKLTFQFIAVTMTGHLRYLYRIRPEPGDAEWVALPVQQEAAREVSIFGLESGLHRFELIALNRDLYELNEAASPAVTLSLRVGAPFWKRWWFYTLALTLLGLAAVAAVAARRVRGREYVLPKELRSYMPIEPNPYIVGNPIRGENMFYGREDDFRYVRTKLEAVSQGVVIVFCGERRVGKSSILYQVLNGRLGERFIPVFVDMQEMVIGSDSEFFARLARLIVEAIARADSRIVSPGEDGAGRQSASAALGAAVAGAGGVRAAVARVSGGALSVPEFDGRNPYPVFIDFLDEALAAVGDRTLLILLDEYELVEAKVDDGKLSSELFTFLAGLMDNKERLSLIFTGSRRLEERDKKYWRELLRRSLFRKVGFLSEKDSYRLMTEPVAGRIVYGRGVTTEIYRLTAGQPFYTQVICQNTVDYLNEHRQNWVTMADLKHVIADIIDNPLPQMIYAWDGLSDDEKLVASLLAEALADGHAHAMAFELRAAVKANEYPVNLSEHTIRLTLEEMYRRELLDKDADGGFRFKIDLFRSWIRRSHSIWQVVKEVRTL
ncbi:MAG TPA: two-component regulator propeller domain-containing protein [Blastocatellia bacterium]|jgi:ligand-binding sensor domain-containing protein|nr:two-component regulator propeller domain-containing protein [Blastocatellia bacterium]